MKRTDIPEYPVSNIETMKPGLYLGLFHGRSKPDEELDDWGFGGPVIGPLEYVHTTYAGEVKIKFVEAADFRRYFPDERKVIGFSTGPNYASALAPGIVDDLLNPEFVKPFVQAGVIREVYENDQTQLRVDDGMLVFDGEYYGDWTVFVIGNILPTAAQIAKEIK